MFLDYHEADSIGLRFDLGHMKVLAMSYAIRARGPLEMTHCHKVLNRAHELRQLNGSDYNIIHAILSTSP